MATQRASRRGAQYPSWQFRLRRGISVSVAAQFMSTALLAQSTQEDLVRDALACRQCSIVTRTVATLGTADSLGFIPSAIHTVAVDNRGRYWVLAGDEPPLVFDSTGRFEAKAGRTGRGPGEFVRPIDALPTPGDSMLIIDGALARGTVLDRHLKPVRTTLLVEPLRPLVLLDWPDGVIANGTIGLPNSVGWPLHRVSFATNQANVLSSFGPDSGEVRPHEGPRLQQVLGRSQHGGFWSADVLRYRITRWSSQGEKTATLERRPRWFSGESKFWVGNPSTPPPPAISAIVEDDAGNVWVFVRIAAPTWREAWPKNVGMEVDLNKMSFEKMFHTTIEVIEPGTRRVISRTTLPHWLIAALPGMRAAAYTVDEGGVPHVEVIELKLQRSSR